MLATRGATELCEAATVLRQCVGALLHLHSHGIVHRDVKPSNICFASPISDLRRSSLREEQVSNLPPCPLCVSESSRWSRCGHLCATQTACAVVLQVKLIDFGLARLLPFPCISPPVLSRSPPS